jgi:hypothetical protein
MVEELTDLRGQLEAKIRRIDGVLGGLRELVDDGGGELVDATVPTNGNGNGHTEATDLLDHGLGRLLEVMRKAGTPVSAKKLHSGLHRKGGKDTHESATYGLLKRAKERGLVTRSGEKGKYRYAIKAS